MTDRRSDDILGHILPDRAPPPGGAERLRARLDRIDGSAHKRRATAVAITMTAAAAVALLALWFGQLEPTSGVTTSSELPTRSLLEGADVIALSMLDSLPDESATVVGRSVRRRATQDPNVLIFDLDP